MVWRHESDPIAPRLSGPAQYDVTLRSGCAGPPARGPDQCASDWILNFGYKYGLLQGPRPS